MAGQLTSDSQERGETNKMRFSCCAPLRAAHLHARAPGHNTAPLPWGPYPQSKEDHAVHHCPIPLPTLIDGTLLWQQPGFSLQRYSLRGCHLWGREASLGAGLTQPLNSDGVQGDGGPSWRWVTDVHVGSGCLPGWEVKHRGAVLSASHGRLWHGCPSLLPLHHVPFYSFTSARLHRLRCAKNVRKHADNALFSLRI